MIRAWRRTSDDNTEIGGVPRFLREAGTLSVVLLTVLLPATPRLVLAQEEPLELRTTLRETPNARTATDEVGELQDGDKVVVTLDQAIVLALQRNMTLAVQRYRRSRSILGIFQNRGIYDVQLTGTVSTRSNTEPTSSDLQDAELIVEETDVGNLTFTQLTPFGGTVRFDYFNTKFDTTDLRQNQNPTVFINADLTFTQPLLRNFGRDTTERNLIVARTDAAISREDFQIQVEEILDQVVRGYWDLVEAREQLSVAEESLTLAEDLDRTNRVQVRVGTMAALEVVQSEAGVAARKEDIITFQTQVEDAADVLRALINLEQTEEAWDAEIVPSTDPELTDHRTIDVREGIETAFEHRPDMNRRRLQNRTLDLDARVARNQKLPQLDLAVTYGLNAIDGDTIVDGVLISRGYSDTFQQIEDGEFEDTRVAIQLGIPIQNRDAKARSAEARLAAEEGEMELENLKLQIRTQVRRAARALEAAVQRIETSKISSRLARRTLEAEEKRYENGLSTSFNVLRIQEDLSEARRREVSATVAYRRAETGYYRSIGQLLERYGIALADDD